MSVLDKFASEATVAWYNHLLKRESFARGSLEPFAGKSARIDTGLFSIQLAVQPGGVLARAEGAPDVIIVLDAPAIAESVLDSKALMRKVRIDGDAEFARALMDVLSRLRPDPAEDLSRFLGDAPAERIVRTLQEAFSQMRAAAEGIARQGADYLVAEFPLLVGTQEFAVFTQEVAELDARLDRLSSARNLHRP